MNLSISNIAWKNEEIKEHLSIAEKLGCRGVEIAPSCIWEEPYNTSKKDVEEILKIIKKYNLEVPSIHSLLYGRNDLHFFHNKEDTLKYLKKIIKISSYFNAKVMVFGSPPNRQINENQFDTYYEMAIDNFREISKECSNYRICFCIEPLGSSFNNFIRTSEEGRKLVEDVDRPNFGLHLDASAISEMKEDLESVFKRNASILKHFHINDTGLEKLGTTNIDHKSIGENIKKSGYNKFLSIEMKKIGNTKLSVKEAINYAKKYYS